MKAPRTKLGQFSFFFLMEFISFFIICASTRAQAKGSYLWTGVTSIAFSAQTFILLKMAVNDEEAALSWSSGAGAIFGGLAGDLLSLWVTMHVSGF